VVKTVLQANKRMRRHSYGEVGRTINLSGEGRQFIKVHVKKLAADHYLAQVGKGRGARYTLK